MLLIHSNFAMIMYKEIDQLKKEITSKLTELLEVKSTLKSKEIEKQDLMKDFLLDIISIIDSFENKETNLYNKYPKESEQIKIIKQYEPLKKKLINLLAKHGVSKIAFPENKLIIGLCKVVGTEPDLTQRNDNIIEVVRSGYIRGNSIIREAELIVVKN